MKWNHDITKLFYEETFLKQEERFSLLQRILKFIFYLGFLMIMIFALSDVNDAYYTMMCDRRMECKQSCNQDYYPTITCQELTSISINYGGNLYTETFAYPAPSNQTIAERGYNICANYTLLNPGIDKYPRTNRQARVHVCFPFCPLTNSTDASCISKGIICVNHDDECEYSTQLGEVTLSTSSVKKDSVAFSPVVAIFAILITLPVHLLFELYCILVSRLRATEKEGTWITIRNITLQVILAASLIIVLCFTGYVVIIVHTVGRPWSFWLTFLFAFVIDQIKSVFLLLALWFFLIRRCGFLQPNEIEYEGVSIANKISIPIVAQLRNLCLQNIETPWFNAISRYLLGIYAGFVLFWLSATDIWPLDEVCKKIDIAFLSVFTVELGIRLFGIGIAYLLDFWNFFDAGIIISSLILYSVGFTTGALPVMRLLRILVVIVVKFTGNQFTISLRRSEDDPVKGLEATLQDLLKETALKKANKEEINWALGVIQQRRFEDMEFGKEKRDMYEETWLKIATKKETDATTWFDKDLEDALNEIHRESEDQAKLRIEEGIDEVRRFIELPNKEGIIANKLTEDLKNSTFDCNVFADFMKDKGLIYLGFKLFTYYDLFHKFQVSPDNFASFLKQATASYYKTNNPYHNQLAVLGILHSLHYFIMEGNLTKHLTDLQIMALLLSGIIYSFSHPGVSNAFLIQTGHSLAIRYNDKSVIENYCLTQAFKVMMDPQSDILGNLTEQQYWSLRESIIECVLFCDISRNFDNLYEFETRIKSSKFPTDQGNDIQLLMNFALYAAHHSAPAKLTPIYAKFFYNRIEEFYQLGDLEKKKALPVDYFFDRTISNPYELEKGYIEVIAQPVIELWCTFLPNLKEDLITKGIEENLKFLQREKEEAESKIRKAPINDTSIHIRLLPEGPNK